MKNCFTYNSLNILQRILASLLSATNKRKSFLMQIGKKTLMISFMMCFAYTGQAQYALKATGGSGAYKDRIWWMDFSGFTVPYGGTATRNFDIGTGKVYVTISDVNFTGAAWDAFPLPDIKLIGYNSSYGWDGLDNLYNRGGTQGLRI